MKLGCNTVIVQLHGNHNTINLCADAGATSIVSPPTDYTIDVLKRDAAHLYHLLDILVDGEMSSQRAGGVAWIARDLIGVINRLLEKLASGQYRGEFTRAAYCGAEVDQSLLYGF